jgi:amino acid adenylation domain-containing protein/non-ribosomal peptide synthase protein (TIGR01720 family)
LVSKKLLINFRKDSVMEGKNNEIIKRRSQLSPAKQAILEKRLRGENNSSNNQKIAIPRRTQQSPVALSPPQQRLWFLQQLEPQSSAYNEFACIQLKGTLNFAILEKSFNEIIKRHESLRTSFKTLDEQPVQVIHPIMTINLPVVNLGNLPQALQDAEVKRLTEEIAQKPFDLAYSPLLRVMLLQISEQEHLLLLVFHHIVCDGWSIQVLNQELAGIYEAFSAEKPSPFSELPIQYADYSIWQHQWLQGKREKTQLSYWKQQLADVPTTLSLPTDRQRPPVQSFRGATSFFKLSSHLTDMLRSLSKQQGVTLFMTLLAAFQAQLYRYTNQEDICVGSPIANRNHADIEGLIGCFVNTLVLRTDLSGNPSFLELLNRVREVCMGAYDHADLPFEQLVGELQQERNLSHTPLFQVMFSLQEDTKKDLVLPGLTLKWLQNYSQTAKFDLVLHVVDSNSELWGWWEYNTDLFDAVTIERMVGHFTNLLEGVASQPEKRLSDLPLLTEPERQTLLVNWNNTATDYPHQQCIHELFEAQVEKTPDAIAVVFESEQLTYRELNTRANQLAHYLQKLGVKPEVLVGICVERSLLMVIGLLAILKAGGAYIPLDPSYPIERIAFILEETQAPVLLTQASLLETTPQHQAQVVCLDTDWSLIAQQSQDNVFSELTTDNLAYVIYTSGSTGKPKGVMIKHASTVAMLDWANKTFTPEARAGVLASTSICFDLSVFEVFVPLCCGGKVILIENALYLATLPAAENVTLINTVPSIISQLIRNNSIPRTVQTVNIAGEPLQNQLVQQLYQQNNIQQVFNLYGPSEDTTYSTSCWIQKGASNTPPIGRPIHNTQAYLLDQNLQPVPVGVPGMLYIGGAGLARGYFNQAELTADKFIPNPYAHLPGERLYKTGDLARYLPNGEIEYIGRIDNQVKIRGFRIELGEIETQIGQHPGVQEAVVAVYSSEADSQRIVAYVVPQEEQTLAIPELRSFLESKLPNYMLPAAFVVLEALPLTPNGKVDRKVLPIPDTTRPKDKKLVAPRNYVETKLTAIWADVLGVEQVSIFDNFFELGGDSILAIVIITRANKAGIQLVVKQLFQHQTVAELASVAFTRKVNQAEQGVITGLVSLTPIQYWFFEQNLLEPHHWNQAVLLEVKQVLDLAVLEKTIQQLLLHHDALRLRFEQTESGWQQVIASPDTEVPLIHLDFSTLSKSEQEPAIEAAATKLQASLNLSTNPLMRVALFDLGHQSSRLLIIIHHLAVDGVSWRILLEDLETVYQQLSQGKKAQLPAKTTSFKYWSERLQEYAQSATRPQEWDYWLRESWQQITPLPVDFPDGDNTVVSVRKISIFLTVEQTQVLLKEVPKAYNTQINDVLLTALVQAFSQWTGNNSLLLALEGHGREEIFDDIDLSRTVGWFTSVFPVLLDLGKTSHPVEALKLVKEQLRGIPNKGMGYGVLRYLSQDIARVESVRSLPQAEIVFNYLGQFNQTFSDSSIFKISRDSQGQTHSPWNRETYLLNIDALVIDNQLKVEWAYSEKIHRQSTIERLAQGFVEALQVLVTHCQSPEVGGYTPSDFPEADLSQQDLERFLRKIK